MANYLPAQSTLSLRLLLAVSLLFGSEVLAWNNPTGHTALEWLMILPGYIALSAVLLDFTVRYRVRDLFGVLVLAGLFSLGAALLIYPQSAFVDMPRTLVTRVMGAHALISAEMIGLFLVLTGGTAAKTMRNLLIGCVIVGLAWGFWVKDWPLEAGYESVSLAVMLAFGIGGIFLVGLVSRYAGTRASEQAAPDDLRLSRQGWGVMILVLGILFLLRAAQSAIDVGALILTVLLLVLSWAIIWFRGRTKGEMLLDGHLPVRPMSLLSMVIAATELIKRKPEGADRFLEMIGQQPPRIIAELQQFTNEFEKTLKIERE